MKKIYFRAIYNTNFRKFQTRAKRFENDTNIHIENINGKKFLVGSADNVKHCIIDILCQDGEYQQLQRTFVKKINPKSKKIDQDAVLTKIDINNPLLTFGAWNSSQQDDPDNKYKGAAIKSSVDVGYFQPLSIDQVCLVNNEVSGACWGGDGDNLQFKCDKNVCNTPEELTTTAFGTLEECAQLFKTERKMNFYNKQPLVLGVYYVDYVINMDTFGRYGLADLCWNEDDCKEFVDKGWRIVTVNNTKYLEMPKATRIKLFSDLVKAIHMFDFETNNSTAGTPLTLLKTSFAVNYADKVANTMVYNIEAKQFDVVDSIKGLSTFNTLSMKSVVNTVEQGVSTNVNAIDDSIEKLIEVGCDLMSNA